MSDKIGLRIATALLKGGETLGMFFVRGVNTVLYRITAVLLEDHRLRTERPGKDGTESETPSKQQSPRDTISLGRKVKLKTKSN